MDNNEWLSRAMVPYPGIGDGDTLPSVHVVETRGREGRVLGYEIVWSSN